MDAIIESEVDLMVMEGSAFSKLFTIMDIRDVAFDQDTKAIITGTMPAGRLRRLIDDS